MARIRGNDWKNLVDAVGILNSDIDPNSLPNRALSSVNKIISGVITAFDFFDGNGVHTGKHWYDPPDSISQSEFEILANVVHEHPISVEFFLKRRFETFQISDFLTTNQFRETGVYNEFYRIYDIDHQILVPIVNSPNSIITVGTNRTRINFSERERLILTMLSKHLHSAIRNADLFERVQKSEQILHSGFLSKSCGIIALDSNHEIVYSTEFGRKMLEKYFMGERQTLKCLPETLMRWVKCLHLRQNSQTIPESPESLNLTKRTDQLSIRCMFNSGTSEITLLLEEKAWIPSKLLREFNLTNRENEILFWISQGKADKDIAFICGISRRTVQKHIENIYVKLGVETRTAAMLKAIEIH